MQDRVPIGCVMVFLTSVCRDCTGVMDFRFNSPGLNVVTSKT